MSKKDIATTLDQDDELDLDQEDLDEEDLEDDEDEEEDDEPAKGKKSPSSVTKKDITEFRSELSDLKKLVQKSGDAGDQKKLSRVDALFQAMLKGGSKIEDLQPLYALVEAIREDVKEESEEGKKKDRQASLDDRCWETMQSVWQEFVAKDPSLEWSEDKILNRAIKLLSTGKSFASAREKYDAGRVPAQKDFRDAIRRILNTYERETGKSRAGKTDDQLDLQSSRAKPRKSAAGANEDIDLKKLTPWEREIYTTTLNVTKNKDLAREALRDLAALNK
jgi:hypothetical protein